jgi:hypothetical protein
LYIIAYRFRLVGFRFDDRYWWVLGLGIKCSLTGMSSASEIGFGITYLGCGGRGGCGFLRFGTVAHIWKIGHFGCRVLHVSSSCPLTRIRRHTAGKISYSSALLVSRED